MIDRGKDDDLLFCFQENFECTFYSNKKHLFVKKERFNTVFFKFREKSSSFLDDGLCIILAGENLDDDGPLAERGRGFREVLFKI